MLSSHTTSSTTIRQLTEFDRTALERHFLSLGGEDRRLRFGIVLPDSALRGYVASAHPLLPFPAAISVPSKDNGDRPLLFRVVGYLPDP